MSEECELNESDIDEGITYLRLFGVKDQREDVARVPVHNASR